MWLPASSVSNFGSTVLMDQVFDHVASLVFVHF